MKFSEVYRALIELIPTRVPVYLWGPPGVGKSSLVKQVAAAMDMDVIDLRAVLLDPVDLRGLPVHDKKADQVRWSPPAFLPVKGKVGRRKGIIFADELAQAAPLVQAAFLQGILDHRIGETELSEDWCWVAASNRQEDRAGTHRVISPLLNRFVHLDLDVSTADWQAWAESAGISPMLRGFINYRPGLLFSHEQNARAFPTPRSWTFVNTALGAVPRDLLPAVAAGAVGEGAAAEFIAFQNLASQLPDLDEVLATPLAAPVPTEPAVLYALSAALVNRIRGADDAVVDNFLAYVGRLEPEFAILTLRDGNAANSRVVRSPKGRELIAKHRLFCT